VSNYMMIYSPRSRSGLLSEFRLRRALLLISYMICIFLVDEGFYYMNWVVASWSVVTGRKMEEMLRMEF